MDRSNYVQGHSPASQARHGNRHASNTCRYFTSLLRSDLRILDVGCGPGSITSSLAQLVAEGQVIGIDFAEEALENARNQPNLPANCTFQIGDAMKLDFDDNVFDVVHTSQVLCHLRDPVAAIKGFRRVLKPGGFIACREGDHDSQIWYPPHPGLSEWRRVQRVMRSFSGTPFDAGRHLMHWTVAAGFESEKCKWSGGTMTYAGKSGCELGLTMAKQVQDDELYRKNLMHQGGLDEKALDLIKEGWEAWSLDECCIFSVICGEIVAYK